MTYQPRFTKCPYQSTNGNKCSNKKSGCLNCIYKDQPENCEQYNDWDKKRKSHTELPKYIKHDTYLGGGK